MKTLWKHPLREDPLFIAERSAKLIGLSWRSPAMLGNPQIANSPLTLALGVEVGMQLCPRRCWRSSPASHVAADTCAGH